MILSLSTTLLLAAALASVSADAPDCSLCEYVDNIGFLKQPGACREYYVCYRNNDPQDPYPEYRFEKLCCAEGLTFDEEHLTCVKQEGEYVSCYDDCPRIPTTTILPCPYYGVDGGNSFSLVGGSAYWPCAPGTVWSQENCTCIRGEPVDTCDKIMNFDFDGTFDSESCNYVVDGTPAGEPSLNHTVLCLNGEDEFLTIAYFNNYFAWNPIGQTFTLCFWMKPSNEADNSGVFSTNCGYDYQESVYDVCLQNGELVFTLGSETYPTQIQPSLTEFSKVCVTFNNGTYTVYFNGAEIFQLVSDPQPVNSQAPATLGKVDGKSLFYGYFDDFCFWNRVLSAQEIYDCFAAGVSNDYYESG